MLGRARGAEISCTLPAEESLYRWYGRILNFRNVITRRIIHCDGLPRNAERISASEYNCFREAYLRELPHVALNKTTAEFQRLLCEAYGGGFFRMDGVVFAASRDEQAWVLHELLCQEPPSIFFEGFRKEEGRYVCSDLPLPEGLVWNLTLD